MIHTVFFPVSIVTESVKIHLGELQSKIKWHVFVAHGGRPICVFFYYMYVMLQLRSVSRSISGLCYVNVIYGVIACVRFNLYGVCFCVTYYVAFNANKFSLLCYFLHKKRLWICSLQSVIYVTSFAFHVRGTALNFLSNLNG